MDKYGLSLSGLASLYRKLTLAGVITRRELDERRRGHEWAAQAFPPIAKEETAAAEPDPIESARETEPPGFFQRHKAEIRASLGVAAGFCLVVALTMIVPHGVKAVKAIVLHRAQVADKQASKGEGSDVDRSIEAFRAISESKAITSESNSEAQSEEYRNCLKSCGDDHSGSADDDSVLRANCRRECVTEHSPRMKRIRETFYK
jgi:hypothetical protein